MTLLFVFQAFFGQLFDHVFTLSQLIYYHWLNVPLMLVQAMPCSVLLATVMTLSQLVRTHELVACYAIGFSVQRLLAIILAVVVMIGSLTLVLEDRVLPPFYRRQLTYYWHQVKGKQDFFLDIKRDKIWYRSQNLIYNLQRFDPHSKTIFGMSIYKLDSGFHLIEVINAEKAEFDGKAWKLMRGTLTKFTSESEFPQVEGFDEKVVTIQETPQDFQDIEKEVNGLRLKELYSYIHRLQAVGADTRVYQVTWHAKISIGVICIVMFLLAIPFSLKKGRRGGGTAFDLFLCLSVTFFYWLFYSISLSLGTNGALPPWFAAWLPSIIFVILAVTLIARKT